MVLRRDTRFRFPAETRTAGGKTWFYQEWRRTKPDAEALAVTLRAAGNTTRLYRFNRGFSIYTLGRAR